MSRKFQYCNLIFIYSTMFRLNKLVLLGVNESLSFAFTNSTFSFKSVSWGLQRSLASTNQSFSSKQLTRSDGKGNVVDLQYLVASKHDRSAVSDPIFILHGLLGSKENWQSMARQLNLKLSRKVYTVDLRNHGSSPHTDEFSYDLMAADVAHLMTVEDVGRATVIGHSMGGRVAMMMTMTHPDLVQNLIVVDISPVGASPKMIDIKQLLNYLHSLPLDRDLPVKAARQQAAVHLREKKYDEMLISFILLNLVESEGQTNWRWKFNIDSIVKSYEEKILKFNIANCDPCQTATLFIGGGNSDYITPQQEKDIKVLFPHAQFRYIQGAGHWVHADKPQEFIDNVVNFLDKPSNTM